MQVFCNAIQDINDIQNAIQISGSEDFDVPKFFYEHLREDIQALEQFLSMNNDDVILLLHLIAKSILDQPCTTDDHVKLLTEDDRSTWEEKFSRAYILPVIQVCEFG